MLELFEERLEKELNDLRAKNLFRKPLICNNNFLNLTSNDYFLLRYNNQVLGIANEIAKQYGTGSGASPLLSGYLPCHQIQINKL